MSSNHSEIPVYIGTYTNAGGKGIYRAQFDSEHGTLSEPVVVAQIPSPSFLALHPSGQYLYAVIESTSGTSPHNVAAFQIDPRTGGLKELNRQSSHGGGACHLAVDHQGRNVLVANYGGGSIAVVPIDEHGHLQPASCNFKFEGKGLDPKRQEAPHAHQICLDPTGRFAFVPDLGLDHIRAYRLESSRGLLIPADRPVTFVTPGSGPRHIAFHPSRPVAYVINELVSTIDVYSFDNRQGSLERLQTVSSLPQGYTGPRWAAEIAAHSNGRWLYASNRGHDSIAWFEIDPVTSQLRHGGEVNPGGKTPRHFSIDPSGKWVICANQDSGNVVVFAIENSTGALNQQGKPIDVPSPVCVICAPNK